MNRTGVGWKVAVVTAALALLAAAGCGDSDGDGAAGEGREVTIGVIVPLEGGLVEYGRDIRNAVELAVDQANERDAIEGWRITLRALDDSSDPDTGAAAARQLAEDDSVIGVVGTYNSGVAREVAPILDEAGIVMISPGNTDPALTRGDDAAAPQRQYEHYFRMVATDSVQGPFLARQAAGDLGFRQAAVISETKPVSKGLADAFAPEFTDAGGEVVHREVVPDGTTDFTSVLDVVRPLEPDVIFFGGEYQVAAELRAQATAAGLTAPLMGGDGIKDEAYIESAAAAAEGDYASSIGEPVRANESAEEFLADLDAEFDEPVSDFGPYAFDAANIIISAAATALADAITPAVRSAVLEAVQETDIEGVSGPVAFDEFGDTTTKVLTLYKVVSGAWTPEKTETVS